MLILPAIDIIDGKPVRLYKGDYSKKEIVAKDVLETVKHFEEIGADWIHLVDLDGAKEKEPKNMQLILKVAKEIKTPIEIGGGIRNLETIKKYIEGGVKRVILGTAAIEDEKLLRESIKLYGNKIAVGIDCKDEYICGDGWLYKSKIHYIEFAKKLEKLGVKNIIVTDISKDGTLEGPNIDMLKKLKGEVSIDITASGGIKDINDIKKLKELNIYGAITGKAIYKKTLDLEESLKVSKD
ncbi:1-(5-phosphoribosyl)-5-[(5-phosphoribosylamino)methylideneamino]imidazole-4-carboxamide isomerase [Clostridium thermobutyricum]|uniref:1-(5-phosphoribosyl)-5-[(5- phosphoribosylamino)methylideneamino]imidazole-4- carboxamide isomerase n=1 Tax=Clostridium thermobutyricum TaxID=29372 RepID=UPI0018AAC1A1|nr:1-(5-phosphoribosyl)-5-[(5-phosphoribosylamino)methylideneamino]imidazole-4-carboxamide isomerase [Clostridium thermobutyricum]